MAAAALSAQVAQLVVRVDGLKVRATTAEARATTSEARAIAAELLVGQLETQLQTVNIAQVQPRSNTVRIVSDHIGPANSIVLDNDQTEVPLTVEIAFEFSECSRKMKRSAGAGNITVAMFSEITLILLD